MLKTEKLYQWDTNKRLEVDNRIITEVQFSNIFSEEALVVAVYEENGKRYVNIPDELLTEPYTLHAYASCGDCVEEEAEFRVIKRAKPDDYAYSAIPIASGRFHYSGENAYITINHNLGKLPSKIMLYCVKKGSTPSSSTVFTSYSELLHTVAVKNDDDTYTTNALVVSYTRFAYYSSKSSSSTQQYMTRQNLNNYNNSSYCIINIGETSFTVGTSGIIGGVEYEWIAIG